MKPLRRLFDLLAPHFGPGGRCERFGPLFRATDNFFFTGTDRTHRAPFVRDVMDLKRVMFLVVIALIPPGLMAVYNTGYQANLSIGNAAHLPDSWHTDLLQRLGFQLVADQFWSNVLYGLVYLVPVLVVTYAVGAFWEILFGIVRRTEISESFLVTGAIFALILPPNVPLWQVALGISFGVVFGKMVFGGTGYNVFNPALVGRAFLFFAYPAQMSGDKVWVAVDGVTSATPLALAKIDAGSGFLSAELWWKSFAGLVPGSMGETSALACLIGALILVVTRVASWRIMLGVTFGTIGATFLLNGLATNPYMAMPFWWHMVLGGWAFGTVYMATEPVTAPFSNVGRWIYGLCIGALVVVVRVLNPSFPEGMMLLILLMNIFAPLIDWCVTRAVVRGRRARYV